MSEALGSASPSSKHSEVDRPTLAKAKSAELTGGDQATTNLIKTPTKSDESKKYGPTSVVAGKGLKV